MARRARGDGQIVERVAEGGCTFAIRYRVPGHGRVQETLGTAPAWNRTRAEQSLEDRKAQVRLGLWEPPRKQLESRLAEPVPIFWTFAEGWYRRHALEVQERTREHWLWALDGHLREAFGPYALDAVTAELIDSYKARKLAAELSAESVNKTLRLLSRIMEEAVEYGHVATNPARGKNRRLRVKTPRRIWLELDEVRSLLDAAGDYRRELTTQVFAGLRISELGNLRWRAIDLEHGRLEVEESKTEAGEGSGSTSRPFSLRSSSGIGSRTRLRDWTTSCSRRARASSVTARTHEGGSQRS